MEKPKTREELVKLLVTTKMTEEEHDELIDMLIDNPISVNLEKKEKESLTNGDKCADKISSFTGSWKFISLFLVVLIVWILLNTLILTEKIDPYPFILLNLFLSLIASIQAPIIMMSQNRQAKKDSLRNENDYITDLKSELILEELHYKIIKIEKNQKKILKFIEESNLKD